MIMNQQHQAAHRRRWEESNEEDNKNEGSEGDDEPMRAKCD